MKSIFYFTTIIPLLFEMITFCNTNETFRIKTLAKEIQGNKNWVNDPDIPSHDKNTILIMGLITIFYFAWMVIGLFTVQWYIFVLLFALSYIPKKTKWYLKIDSFITICILMFIVINAYHPFI